MRVSGTTPTGHGSNITITVVLNDDRRLFSLAASTRLTGAQMAIPLATEVQTVFNTADGTLYKYGMFRQNFSRLLCKTIHNSALDPASQVFSALYAQMLIITREGNSQITLPIEKIGQFMQEF